MTFDFRKSALKTILISDLMAGREKISTADLIRNFPNGVTINAVDMIYGGENGDYPVVTFAEDETKFYASGGVVWKKIVTNWLEGFNGNAEQCSQALASSGGVRVKFSERKSSKSGFTYTLPEII